MYINIPNNAESWKSPVETVGDLPTLGNEAGDARTIKNDGSLFIWDGSTWVLSGGGGSVDWGDIGGTLSDQTDLQTVLDLKAPLDSPTFTGLVSGPSYVLPGLSSITESSSRLVIRSNNVVRIIFPNSSESSAGLSMSLYDSDVNTRDIGDPGFEFRTGRFGTSLQLVRAGAGLLVKEGSNATMGVVTLVAGEATIATTKITANSRVWVTSQSDGGVPGFLRISARNSGTDFTITSSSVADTSEVAWWIVEPAP